MLLQTWGSLQQLKALVNDKGHEKLKFELPWRDEVRHKYDFLNQMINTISQVWKKRCSFKLFQAVLLIDTSSSIILNWLLRGTNLSTENCICWISFWNYMISDILQCRIYSKVPTIHPSGVVFKGVLESQIRNNLSRRKWVIISKI